MRPPPESTTIDGSGPGDNSPTRYEVYQDSDRFRVGETPDTDSDLSPKVSVIGVVDGDTACAYPLPAVREAGVVNDTVGDRPVAVAAADRTLVAYERTVDGAVLEFDRADAAHLAVAGVAGRH